MIPAVCERTISVPCMQATAQAAIQPRIMDTRVDFWNFTIAIITTAIGSKDNNCVKFIIGTPFCTVWYVGWLETRGCPNMCCINSMSFDNFQKPCLGNTHDVGESACTNRKAGTSERYCCTNSSLLTCPRLCMTMVRMAGGLCTPDRIICGFLLVLDKSVWYPAPHQPLVKNGLSVLWQR